MKHKWKQAALIGCAVLGITATLNLSGQAAAAVNTSPDLNTLLKDSVALSIGSPNSLSFGEAKFIDKENSEITPYIKNQRTLTPLRFISENLGATVTWNQAASTVTIKDGPNTMKITLGSSTVWVNGKKSLLDAPAEIKQGRVFVPLRYISETLGLTVFYERGLIVIGDKSVLTPKQDAQTVDYIQYVLAPDQKMLLTEHVTEAVSHPDKPVIYTIDDSKSRIRAYDLVNQKQAAVSPAFKETPRKMTYANGELYVIFTYTEYNNTETEAGVIRVLDPDTLSVKDSWEIDITPYNIVADDSGKVYVNSGSDRQYVFKSYDRYTHQELSSIRNYYNKTNIVMHPDQTRIYGVNQGVSPRDMEVFHVNEGIFTSRYDSPYHGDHDMGTVIAVTGDGRYIINSSGAVFTSTKSKSSDMYYVGSIPAFDAIATSPDHEDQFFVVKGNLVYQIDADTMLPLNTFRTEGTAVQLMMSKDKLIAITKIKTSGTNITKSAVEMLKPL